MKRFFISTFIVALISCIFYCIVIDYSTPEVYIKTNVYDGFVKDDFWCSKHKSEFVDTKTGKTIVIDHASYLAGKYKLENGDHIYLEQIVTKRVDYHYSYRIKVNGKDINAQFKSVHIIKMKN